MEARAESQLDVAGGLACVKNTLCFFETFCVDTSPMKPSLLRKSQDQRCQSAARAVKDGRDVSRSMGRRLMGRSSKCVKAVKQPVLTAAASLVRCFVRIVCSCLFSILM